MTFSKTKGLIVGAFIAGSLVGHIEPYLKKSFVRDSNKKSVIENNQNFGCEISQERLKEYRDYALKQKTKLLGPLNYAEAAGLNAIDWRYITETVMNRVSREDYPNTMEEVIFEDGAFPSTKSKLWDDVQNRKLTNYEIGVLNECYKTAEMVLSGGPRTEVVAFHANNIPKPKSSYWDNMELVVKTKGQSYYRDKRDGKSI